MKASTKPQFSKKWWDSERPPELKSTELDKALPKAESALAEQRKKKDDPRAVENCLAALKAVPIAAAKTMKQCDKKKHKDLISVLEKYEDLVADESARLEQIKETLEEEDEDNEGDEDEVEEGKLFEKDYLYKMLKMLKSGGKPLKFAFGLNTSAPESSKLLLKRKGKPEALFKALKKTGEFNNRLLTYGVAEPDPSDGKTLVFRLEKGANEPPRILKLGREFLRSDKGLKFRNLSVVLPGGKTVADTDTDANETGRPATRSAR
jgi:hypothetical protein